MSSKLIAFSFVCCFWVWSCLANVQPPAEDQCQALNATEPPECPQTIGPPCPPCIINTSPDYTSGDNATIPSTLQPMLSMLIDEYVSFWLSHYGPNKTYPNNSNLYAATWAEGDAGRSQLFLRLYYYTQNESYFNIAKMYFNHGMSIIPSTQQSADFFTSQVGLWTIGAVINNLEFNKMYGQTELKYDSNNDIYIGYIRDTLTDVRNGIISNSKYSPKYNIDLESATIFGGLSGALYSALLINTYFDDNRLLSPTIISNISYYLLDYGLATNKQLKNNYLDYPTGFTPGCYMPGAAHGSSGVLNQILNAYVQGYLKDLFTINNGVYYNGIKNTIDHYGNMQLADGNIPPYVENDTVCVKEANELNFGNDTDSRVQWCHGAPGFLDTIPKAIMIWTTMLDDDGDGGGVTTNETLLNIASNWMTIGLKALNSTWQRGLLIKGLMMCHGVGGNAYTILQYYDNLNRLLNNVLNSNVGKSWKGFGKYSMNDVNYYKEQSAWRASQFVQWTLNKYHDSKLRTQYSNENGSPWLGSYGIPFIWIQAMQNGWPYSQPVCMPAWNLCIP